MEGWILLAVLVCPVVMGTMMFLMWRGMRHRNDSGAESQSPEVGRESGLERR